MNGRRSAGPDARGPAPRADARAPDSGRGSERDQAAGSIRRDDTIEVGRWVEVVSTAQTRISLDQSKLARVESGVYAMPAALAALVRHVELHELGREQGRPADGAWMRSVREALGHKQNPAGVAETQAAFSKRLKALLAEGVVLGSGIVVAAKRAEVVLGPEGALPEYPGRYDPRWIVLDGCIVRGLLPTPPVQLRLRIGAKPGDRAVAATWSGTLVVSGGPDAADRVMHLTSAHAGDVLDAVRVALVSSAETGKGQATDRLRGFAAILEVVGAASEVQVCQGFAVCKTDGMTVRAPALGVDDGTYSLNGGHVERIGPAPERSAPNGTVPRWCAVVPAARAAALVRAGLLADAARRREPPIDPSFGNVLLRLRRDGVADLVATDRRRATRTRISLEGAAPGGDYLIPAQAVLAVSRVSDGGAVRIAAGEARVSLQRGTVEVIADAASANPWPDVERLIPDTAASALLLDRDGLEAALRNALRLADAGRYVEVHATGAGVHLTPWRSSAALDAIAVSGELVDGMPIRSEDVLMIQPLRLDSPQPPEDSCFGAFDAAQLLECVANMICERIVLGRVDRNRAFVLTGS